MQIFTDSSVPFDPPLVMAVSAVANIVKSSLGPVGLDKMLVDDVGVRWFLVSIIVAHHLKFRNEK